jgi:hypothetical protein
MQQTLGKMTKLKRFNLFSNCKFATFGAKNKLSAMIQN